MWFEFCLRLITLCSFYVSIYTPKLKQNEIWLLPRFRISIMENMCIRLIARKLVLFWLGFESAKNVFLVTANRFINGINLNQLG
jgi:hypothetical protein